MNTSTIATQELSVLKSLRSLVPPRTMLFAESLRIAERQAIRLRELQGIDSEAFPEGAIAELPRIRVVRRSLPTLQETWGGEPTIQPSTASQTVSRRVPTRQDDPDVLRLWSGHTKTTDDWVRGLSKTLVVDELTH